MSRKHKKMLARIIVSAALLTACALSPLEGYGGCFPSSSPTP